MYVSYWGLALMTTQTVQERFEVAFDRFVEQVKLDDHILAVIVCGSLSHDQVWEKSDIDLIVICDDDMKAKPRGLALVEDEINIHAEITRRSDFKKLIEGSIRNSFMHSLIAKSKLVYSRDPTLHDIYDQIHRVGARDTQVQLLRAGSMVPSILYKAEKWLHVKRDLDYAAHYVIHCATPLAQIEVFLANQLAGREVIRQAIPLNPVLFKQVYTDMLNQKKTVKKLQDALDTIDGYLESKTDRLFGPVLEYLREESAVLSVTQIEDYFDRHMGVNGVVMACEWLADKGIITKASVPAKLTRQSQTEVEEMAFFYGGPIG